MARDRKRAKQRQRRTRRSSSRAAVGRPGGDSMASPNPLEHASADVDLAELAERTGLPAEEPPTPAEEAEARADLDAELEEEEELEALEEEAELEEEKGDLRAARRARAAAHAAPRRGGNRFVNFLRGCVVELRRVQWPDRRQVTQATGVVLGFVIIAGAYLGILDAIWSRVVNAIL